MSQKPASKMAGKAAGKMGRNPFNKKASVHPAAKKASRSARQKKSPAGRSKSGSPFFRPFASHFFWRMNQFSILNFDRADGRRRLLFLSVGLKNPAFAAKRVYDWSLLKKGPFVLTLFSVKIGSP